MMILAITLYILGVILCAVLVEELDASTPKLKGIIIGLTWPFVVIIGILGAMWYAIRNRSLRG